MATPRSLVFHLHRYWDVVESLSRLSRELPAFEERQVLAIISQQHPQAGEDDAAAILRSLCNVEVLQWLSRSSSLQLNPLVLDFVRGLTREHELGLSSVLKARVEAIKQATAQLSEGLDRRDDDRMRRGAARLADLFRQISQQLDQDRHAILELAEKAKASDAAMPISRRYQAVLEAYDQYVEPMNEMMDSSLAGTFYPYLEAAEQALDAATEALSVQGALYSHRLQLRQVGYQAKELRRLGRVVAQQCADTLLPLREEARQHNALSAAISQVLGRARKQGLRRGLKATTRDSRLPLWRQERGRRVSVGDEIRTLIAEARDFVPRVEAFPEEQAGDPAEMAAWVDEAALRAELGAALPVDNLMTWLRHGYGHLPDTVVLRLYHDLVRDTRWSAALQATPTSTALNAHRVHYYPHRLESPHALDPLTDSTS